jgi:hypothetical protein
MQQSPCFSLDTMSQALFAHAIRCNRLLRSMSDGLHLQGAQHCPAFRRIQTWLTHNDPLTLVVAIDTLMIADLLPKGVLQTFSYTGTKDLSKAGAVVMPMKESLMRVQKLCNSYVASSTSHVTSTKRHTFILCALIFSYQCTYLAHVNIQSNCPDDKRSICVAHLVCMLICNMMPSI